VLIIAEINFTGFLCINKTCSVHCGEGRVRKRNVTRS